MSPPSFKSPPRLLPRQSSSASSAPTSAPTPLAFQPSCPSGGKFWVCTTGSRFVGCCDTENSPCALGCTAGALRSTSFNASAYGTFPDLECSNSALFYTCTKTKPGPFMGCCKSNPCKGGVGCDQTDLGGALLPQNAAASAHYVTSTATATTAPGKSTGTAMAETQPQERQGISSGTIVGLSVGIFFFILVLITALAWFCGRRAGKKSAKGQRGHFVKLPQQEEYSSMHSRGPSYEYARGSGEHMPMALVDQMKRGRYSPYTDSFPSPVPTYQPLPVSQSGHSSTHTSPSMRHDTFSHAHARTASHELPTRNTIVVELDASSTSQPTTYQPIHSEDTNDSPETVTRHNQNYPREVLPDQAPLSQPISNSQAQTQPQPQPQPQPKPKQHRSPQTQIPRRPLPDIQPQPHQQRRDYPDPQQRPGLRHKPRLQPHQIQILGPIDTEQYDRESSSIQKSPEDGRLTDRTRGLGLQADTPEIQINSPPPDYYADDIAKRQEG